MLIYLDAGSTWMSWPTWRTRPRPRANRRADNGAANHWPTFFSSQFTAFRYFDEWTRFFKVCLAQAQLTTSNPSFKEPKRVLFLPHCISFFFPQHWMECCIDSVVHHMMIIATIQAHGVSNLTLHITFTTLWNESRWKTRATISWWTFNKFFQSMLHTRNIHSQTRSIANYNNFEENLNN